MGQNTQIPAKKRLLALSAIFGLPIIAVIVLIVSLTSGHKKNTQKASPGSAFNTTLPSPNLPNTEKNKLEIYMQAQQDSLKRKEAKAKDPYANDSSLNLTTHLNSSKQIDPTHSTIQFPRQGPPATEFQDDNEKKVNDRIKQIYAALGRSPVDGSEVHPQSIRPGTVENDGTSERSKLENLMQQFQQRDTQANPQLQQVKEVLDKIMNIQHPERLNVNTTLKNKDELNFPVYSQPKSTPDSDNPKQQLIVDNGFFGLDDEIDSNSETSSPLQAVIHTTQTIQSGSIVKLRLLQPIYVNGQKIPSNSFIYGPATIAGERVTIQLTNAIYDGKIYPISLKVFDGSDGLEGLYVPGLITRDVVKQGMSQGITGMNVATLDPSLGAQAAAAGIETARNLLSRKVSLIKATLKAGHIAILKNTNQH